MDQQVEIYPDAPEPQVAPETEDEQDEPGADEATRISVEGAPPPLEEGKDG